MAIDALLEGLTIIPDRYERQRIEGSSAGSQGISEERRARYAAIQDGLIRAGREFALIEERTDGLLALYDEVVLGEYVEEAAAYWRRQREDTCVPCFTSYPSDQPAWVQIGWSFGHLPYSEDTQFGALIERAADLSGADATMLHYMLRDDLTEGIAAARNFLQGLWTEDLLEMDDESEHTWQIASDKEQTLGLIRAVQIRYQFMTRLVERKLN